MTDTNPFTINTEIPCPALNLDKVKGLAFQEVAAFYEFSERFEVSCSIVHHVHLITLPIKTSLNGYIHDLL